MSSTCHTHTHNAQTCVAYWTAKEGLSKDAKTKADVEFCLANDLLEVEDETNKYDTLELNALTVPVLRKMCADEVASGGLENVAEPMLFGKKKYLVEQLSGILTQPSGMREFVNKKLNKIEAVGEKMAYQQTRIKFFKDALEDAKLQAAQAVLQVLLRLALFLTLCRSGVRVSRPSRRPSPPCAPRRERSWREGSCPRQLHASTWQASGMRHAQSHAACVAHCCDALPCTHCTPRTRCDVTVCAPRLTHACGRLDDMYDH